MEDMGTLRDFYGHHVVHSRELPRGMTSCEEVRQNELLPHEAYLHGWELFACYPNYSADPYVLYDQYGHILYQWPDDYTPSWVEVKEVCERFY